jgi:hypothetical protein
LRAAQNEAERTAQMSQSRLDEEEIELNEQEAAEAARLTIEAAKAKSNRSRVRRELERKCFEVNAVLSETLAQIEDDDNNDLRSSHGLDAESVGDWVSTTHRQNLEVSDASVLAHYTLPFTNSEVSSTVTTNVIPTCMIVTPSSHNVNMVDTTSASLVNFNNLNIPLSNGAIVDPTVSINHVSQTLRVKEKIWLFPGCFPVVFRLSLVLPLTFQTTSQRHEEFPLLV